ncbi:MAG: DUF2272 domain-containing protein [Bdellovibrio bacteriovorus]
MFESPSLRIWPRTLPIVLACLALLSCATPPPAPAPGTWSGRPFGSAPARNPALRQAMINRATREWEYFGRQTVVFKGSEESIPHVGSWEDDDARYSDRVNAYWQAVGKPGLDGMDCMQPWSAAFMSWVMQGAGVPESQFPRAPAHWIYLASLIDQAPYPGRWFVPRRVADYSPNPGDLVCASRGGSRPLMTAGYTTTGGVDGIKAHCDLVVAKNSQTLEVIGGNVRNSVSRSTLELDSQGRLQAVPRRPWFLILENRL